MSSMNGSLHKTLIVLISVVLILIAIKHLKKEKHTIGKTSESAFNCVDHEQIPMQEIRGRFMIFRNYILPTETFKCHKAVTYSVHSDVTFLGHLETLTERHEGPVSLAIYAPGFDFKIAIRKIASMRSCGHRNVKKFVTFHIIFDLDHFPKGFSKPLVSEFEDAPCVASRPEVTSRSYRSLANLSYPINLARNVASQESQTHFVMSADIELLPSRDFSGRFIELANRKRKVLDDFRPAVFVLPIFEVARNAPVPESRAELLEMGKWKQAQIFHAKVCDVCHTIPKFSYENWMISDVAKLDIASVRKRKGVWEPFFVGTKLDPLFDERLFWEGQGDRLPQIYAMCLLNYKFIILNDAFLVHKPGIKTQNKEGQTRQDQEKTQKFMKSVIKRNLDDLYKDSDVEDCEM